VEYFTDPVIVEAARKALGGQIDLDPASSEKANEIVKAERIFTVETDAMTRDWNCGTLWMNHPFGRAETACVEGCKRREKNPKHVCHPFTLYGNDAWIQKMMQEMVKGHITYAACNITFASTSEAWFSKIADCPHCWLTPRTNYRTPDSKIKKGVTKGSVVTYIGRDVKLFAESFSKLGFITVPYVP
jgi:hypothetical protein